LLLPAAQQQRVHGVAAETHVGQAGPGSVGRVYQQGQVVERRPEAVRTMHAGADHDHVGAEGPQQQRESAVELVTEPAPPPGHDLVEQLVLVQGYGLGQVDAQVLERHRQLMGPVQDPEGRRVDDLGAADADAVKVGGNSLVVHHASACPWRAARDKLIPGPVARWAALAGGWRQADL